MDILHHFELASLEGEGVAFIGVFNYSRAGVEVVGVAGTAVDHGGAATRASVCVPHLVTGARPALVPIPALTLTLITIYSENQCVTEINLQSNYTLHVFTRLLLNST